MGSQYNEDQLLANILPDLGSYLDVGCADPEALSNTFRLYQKGWRGVCVDMRDTPDLRARWAAVRPEDTIKLGEAVAERAAQSVGTWGDVETASLVPKWGAQQAGGRQVATRCLHEFWGSQESPTLLSLDVEGYEMAALLGNDWEQMKPKFIIVESIEYRTFRQSWKEWEPTLIRHGYRFVAASALNRIYKC